MENEKNIHFVKFMRGPTSAWEALQATPEKISNDTLYFIYQDVATSKNGKLYLGQKLISGAGGGGDININDIGDVYIDNETLADKQILVYNDTSERWENASLSAIINTAIGIMQGATAEEDGQSGLVPMPKAGDQDKFLRGDGNWATVNIPTFNTDIFTLNNNEVSLNGFDFAPVGSVPIKTSNGLEWTSAPSSALKREITTLEKLRAQLDGTDKDPLDPNTIYMVLNDSDSSENKYDEYMIINDTLEQLGTFGQVDLNNYVTIDTFNSLQNALYDVTDDSTGETQLGLISRVSTIENNYVTKSQIGDLNNLLLSEGNSTLVDEVNTLSDRLKWHELQNN